LKFLHLDEDLMESILMTSKLCDGNASFKVSLPYQWHEAICYVYQGNVNVYDSSDWQPAGGQREVNRVILSQLRSGSIFKLDREALQRRQYECTM